MDYFYFHLIFTYFLKCVVLNTYYFNNQKNVMESIIRHLLLRKSSVALTIGILASLGKNTSVLSCILTVL